MTSYNPVNGTWTAGNYDLTTAILRGEWGYTGFVMSDWFARTKFENFERYYGKINQSERDYIPCVEAQNDIYMCCFNIANFKTLNVYDALVSGRLARAFAQRNAMNICRYLMHSTAMTRLLAMSEAEIRALSGNFKKGKLLLESAEISVDNAVVFDCKEERGYVLGADIYCEGTHLSQNTVILCANEEYLTSFTVAGANGKVTRNEKRVTLKKGLNRITLKEHAKTVSVEKICIYEEL
jgi:beta-glucosidase